LIHKQESITQLK